MARSRSAAAVLAATAVVALVPAASAAGTGTAAVMIQSISLSGDYAASHRVYATGARSGCTKDCALLLATADGARTWTAAQARGWVGGPVTAVSRAGGEVVLAPTDRGVQVSVDGGATFSRPVGPAGQIAVTHPEAGDAAVSGPAAPALYRIADGSARTLPAFDLKNATLVLNPAYPASRGPAALVAGTDPSTHFPVVERCDTSLRCSARTVLVAKNDVPRLFLSPRFDADGVVVAATVAGSAFMSRDHGATFTPITVQKPLADATITTVQSVSFTPDFDGSRGTGAVYASVLSVRNTKDEKAVHGGVYRASDPRGPWRKFGGASLLDTGSTAVVAAPDGRVYAAYVDALRGSAGVLCARGTRWGTGCAFPRAAASPATRPAGSTPTAAPASGRPATAAPVPAATPAPSTPVAAPPTGGGDSGGVPMGAVGGGVLGLGALAGAAGLLLRKRLSPRRTRSESPA